MRHRGSLLQYHREEVETNVTQLTITDAIDARDQAMEAVAQHAGDTFQDRALAFVLAYLTVHGETAGEVLTEACRRAGIVPHDDRAFGPVYMKLSRQGLIEKCGTVLRRRGHGTAGGHVWKLTSTKDDDV